MQVLIIVGLFLVAILIFAKIYQNYAHHDNQTKQLIVKSLISYHYNQPDDYYLIDVSDLETDNLVKIDCYSSEIGEDMVLMKDEDVITYNGIGYIWDNYGG